MFVDDFLRHFASHHAAKELRTVLGVVFHHQLFDHEMIFEALDDFRANAEEHDKASNLVVRRVLGDGIFDLYS